MQTIIGFELNGLEVYVLQQWGFYFVSSTEKQPLPCVSLGQALDVFDFCVQQFGPVWMN